MAKASVIITCITCGKEFRHEAIRANRREADSYAEWAKDHITTCPDCYRAQQAAGAEARYTERCESLGLPDLTGVSDKQIAYAHKVRREFLADHYAAVERWITLFRHPDFARVRPETIDNARAQSREMDRAYTVAAEANAGKGLKVKDWMKPIFMYVVPVAILVIYIYGLATFNW